MLEEFIFLALLGGDRFPQRHGYYQLEQAPRAKELFEWPGLEPQTGSVAQHKKTGIGLGEWLAWFGKPKLGGFSWKYCFGVLPKFELTILILV